MRLGRSFSSARAVRSPGFTTALATPSPSPSYPFSPIARKIPTVLPPSLPLKDNLMRTLNAHLTSLHPNANKYSTLFSRRHQDRLLTGSVLTVNSYISIPTLENPKPSINAFSGVLIAMRRRHFGRDTSFRLRNMIGKTGVEVAFKLFSPLLAEIKVVSRAARSGPVVLTANGTQGNRKAPALRAAKRAKMYYVREQGDKLVGVSGIIKQAREKELMADKKRR